MSQAGSEAAAEASQPFSGKVVAALLAVGLVAFAGFVALGAYAPELADGTDGGAHALSRSAVGYAGLAKLLKLSGREVVISRGPMAQSDAPGVRILAPPPDIGVEDARRFLQEPEPKLIVLPKWRTAPDRLHVGWVEKAGPLEAVEPLAVVTAVARASVQASDEDETEEEEEPALDRKKALAEASARVRRRAGSTRPVLHGVNGFLPGVGPYRLGASDSFQTIGAAPSDVLIADETGRPVLFRVAGSTFVLTDPDLLNNQGLKSQNSAALALDIIDGLRGGEGPVVFDVTPNGFARSRSMLRLALGPPFLGASLIALMAGLLMGGHALVRFGPVLRPSRAYDRGKRGLVENSAALIALAGRRAAMGGRYADLVRRAVAKSGLRGARPDRIDEALDRLTPPDQPSFTTLAAEAAMAPGDAEALEAARRLHRWRLEITRERI